MPPTWVGRRTGRSEVRRPPPCARSWRRVRRRRCQCDRIARTAAPHRILEPGVGPLTGVKLHILTRKALGGIQTDLSSRALGVNGQPIDGLYAAGEVADFGGGGVHGYNALEGTFLGGCLFSGRAAGRAAAVALGGRRSSSTEAKRK